MVGPRKTPSQDEPCSHIPGLKSQHVAAIQWLADVTDAEVDGLNVGSRTLTFLPKTPPCGTVGRSLVISAESGAASSLLILQAILPFLIYAGNSSNEPIRVHISGGTNVAFSPSFEYLDQVLLPAMEERFGVRVERELKDRSWSIGRPGRGAMSLTVYPLKPGRALEFKKLDEDFCHGVHDVRRIDASIIVPRSAHGRLQEQIALDWARQFPSAELSFKITEDSGNLARWYILLVADASGGVRWGRDLLIAMSRKARSVDDFACQVSRRVCRDLYREVSAGGQMDQHLQDQIVCFQGLCSGTSSMLRRDEALADMTTDGQAEDANSRMARDQVHEPFGHGSLHAQTARWVVGQLLPGAKFFNKGDVVEGTGFTAGHSDLDRRSSSAESSSG